MSSEARAARVEWDESAPEDADLVDWYGDLHRRLADALAAAPADLECWTFLPAPSPLEFWARRQAHETTVHRVDAEAALGGDPSPVEADFAADGVDEALLRFQVRERGRADRPCTLRLRADDVPGADWLLHLSPEPPWVERGGRGSGGLRAERSGRRPLPGAVEPGAVRRPVGGGRRLARGAVAADLGGVLTPARRAACGRPGGDRMRGSRRTVPAAGAQFPASMRSRTARWPGRASS